MSAFYITIVFNQGPTIIPPDTDKVMLKRVEHTEQRVAKLQAAALTLGATSFVVERDEQKETS